AVAGERLHRPRKFFSAFASTRRQFVMASLPGEQWPVRTNPNPIKRAAILVFAVSIAVVAMPRWPARRVDPQHRVDHFDRIHDARIVGCPHTEADERQRVWADGQRATRCTLRGRTVLNRYEPVLRRRAVGLVR